MVVTKKEIEEVVDKARYIPWQDDKDPTVYAEEVGEAVRGLFERAIAEGFEVSSR